MKVADPSGESTTGLKVLAGLMAIALWGFVGVSQHIGFPETSHRQFSVPVEFKNFSPFERMHAVPAFVTLTAGGPAKALDRLTENDFDAFVQSGPATKGRVPVHVTAPDGIRVQVVPESVSLVTVALR